MEKLSKVQGILKKIQETHKAQTTTYEDKTFYAINQRSIKTLFDKTDSSSFEDIYTRLAVIDNMYSTRMNRRVYCLEELAETISRIPSVKDRFIELAKNPAPANLEKFNYGESELFSDCKGQEELNLFTGCYGIKKNNNGREHALALIYRYAYYETGFKFPPYDNVVKTIYPRICEYCGFVPSRAVSYIGGGRDGVSKGVLAYITAINGFCSELGIDHDYDTLDCFLWYLDKILERSYARIFRVGDFLKIPQEYHRQEGAVLGQQYIADSDLLKSLFDLADDIRNV